MKKIKFIENYCSYKKGQVIEMTEIDAEAIVMSGKAVFIK